MSGLLLGSAFCMPPRPRNAKRSVVQQEEQPASYDVDLAAGILLLLLFVYLLVHEGMLTLPSFQPGNEWVDGGL